MFTRNTFALYSAEVQQSTRLVLYGTTSRTAFVPLSRVSALYDAGPYQGTLQSLVATHCRVPHTRFLPLRCASLVTQRHLYVRSPTPVLYTMLCNAA